MFNGNMQLAARRDGSLLARVGPEQEDEALARPGVERMGMRGRAMTGYVTVPAEELGEDALRDWIVMTAHHVGQMPAKADKRKRASKAGR